MAQMHESVNKAKDAILRKVLNTNIDNGVLHSLARLRTARVD